MGNYASEYYAEDAVFPTDSQVLNSVTFGVTGADLTGNVVLPSISDVRDGTFFGASSALEGTLVVSGGDPDWTDAEKAQIRYRLGIDGTATAPSTATGAQLGDNIITASSIATNALDGKGNWNVGKTGYSLTQAFPANFASLGINSSGHVSRVVLVDTTTANTDMRGTDGANTTTPPTAEEISGQIAVDISDINLDWEDAILFLREAIWQTPARTLTDKTGYSLTQAFPSNFADLGINSSGHISRVVLVDTTTDLTNGGGGGGGANINVLPAVGISADRSPGVTLDAFVGETVTQSITIYQTDGVTPFVLTGKTLVIVFETRQGVDVATVTSGSITIGGDDDNVVTFAYPSVATSVQRVLKFAIRDASAPKTVYLQGLLSVQRAPQVD